AEVKTLSLHDLQFLSRSHKEEAVFTEFADQGAGQGGVQRESVVLRSLGSIGAAAARASDGVDLQRITGIQVDACVHPSFGGRNGQVVSETGKSIGRSKILSSGKQGNDQRARTNR